MQCKNHADVSALGPCVVCTEPFCSHCLVELDGQNYCGTCKSLAIQGRPLPEVVTIPCVEAREALACAIFGVFCLAIILGPVAILKAIRAKNLIAADPRLTGSGKAIAALIISVICLLLTLLAMIKIFSP
ncbi:MAG TPA: hypothetical protein VJ783_10560 [Pirellulales bacterium]|nr:hypothetical protein [Pirellulales bacterium]